MAKKFQINGNYLFYYSNFDLLNNGGRQFIIPTKIFALKNVVFSINTNSIRLHELLSGTRLSLSFDDFENENVINEDNKTYSIQSFVLFLCENTASTFISSESGNIRPKL